MRTRYWSLWWPLGANFEFGGRVNAQGYVAMEWCLEPNLFLFWTIISDSEIIVQKGNKLESQLVAHKILCISVSFAPIEMLQGAKKSA